MYEYEDNVAEYDEYDEAAPGASRMFRSLAVPRRGNVVPAAAPGRPVTQSDLINATRKLDEKIGVNARAIKSIEGRVNTVASHQTRQGKHLETVKNDLKSLREISTLLPLLTTQKSTNIGGTEVLVPTNDTFSKLLPILMLSGGLGGGTSSSGSSDAMGGMGLPLLLVLASQK